MKLRRTSESLVAALLAAGLFSAAAAPVVSAPSADTGWGKLVRTNDTGWGKK